MLQVLVKLDVLTVAVDHAVNAEPDITVLSGVGDDLLVASLLASDYGGEDHKSGALGQRHDAVHDLLGGDLPYFLAANGAVRHAETGI